MVRFLEGILPENLLSFLSKGCLLTCKNMEGYSKFPDRNLARSNLAKTSWLSLVEHNLYKILTDCFGRACKVLEGNHKLVTEALK